MFQGTLLLAITSPISTYGQTQSTAAQPATAPVNNGFTLATVIMIFMSLALVYVLISAVRAQNGALPFGPAWGGNLIPVLAVLGLGVAGYLTFVETRNVAPVCGPVGDCSSVQSSPYARLFGFFPVALLGLLGYVGTFVAWFIGRSGRGQLSDLAKVASFGMALFGVLFSLYLTYLELFVIKAVCAWCLSSAVIITLVMLFTLRPSLAALQSTDGSFDEEEPAEA